MYRTLPLWLWTEKLWCEEKCRFISTAQNSVTWWRSSVAVKDLYLRTRCWLYVGELISVENHVHLKLFFSEINVYVLIFCIIVTCSLSYFGRTSCFHLDFYREVEGSTFLRNVDRHLLHCKFSYLGTQ